MKNILKGSLVMDMFTRPQKFIQCYSLPRKESDIYHINSKDRHCGSKASTRNPSNQNT